MWQAKYELPDTERDRLLSLIATIEDKLAPDGPTDVAPLRAAFTELIGILAVGDPTPSHACPHCKRLSRLGASRCSHCWLTLDPAAPATP